MHRMLVDHRRRLEDDRPHRRLEPPAPIARPLGRRSAERVERVGPRTVRPLASLDLRDRPTRASIGERDLLQRTGREELKRAVEGVAKAIYVEIEMLARAFEDVRETVQLLLQPFAAKPRGLDLLLDGGAFGGIDLDGVDLGLGLGQFASQQAAALRELIDLPLQHLADAAEFLLDHAELPLQGEQHAILRPLRVEEVAAEDLVRGLKLAVDAAVPLLEATGVPRQVEVEEIPAVGLQVEALSRGVGADQDPERVVVRIAVERDLELLAPLRAGGAGEGRDPPLPRLRPLDRGAEQLLKLALRVVVLGEDDDAGPGPRGIRNRLARTRRADARAAVLPHPVKQRPHAPVREHASLRREIAHGIEQAAFLRRVGCRGITRVRRGRREHFLLVDGDAILLGELVLVLVGIEAAGEAGVVGAAGGRRHIALPDSLHALAVLGQGAMERLDRGEQPLPKPGDSQLRLARTPAVGAAESTQIRDLVLAE